MKTRLTPPCTPDQAAALARAALRDTLAAAAAASGAGRKVLVLDGDPDAAWLPAGFEVIPQRGGGLHERLAAAFEDAREPAFLVGMDTPQVTPELLDAGLAAVAAGGSAFGPAVDGGYWAIGLPAADWAVFSGVPMSTERTGAAQRERMAELGLTPVLLPPLSDFDTYDVALAVAADAPDTHFARELAAIAAEIDRVPA